MKNLSRRSFITRGIYTAASVTSGFLQAAEWKIHPTPSETSGPFYPVTAQKDKDFDLTSVEGRVNTAKGRYIKVEGAVVDTEGNSLEGAVVDLWQANAAGRYQHPYDNNPAPVDPGFQGWAIVSSGREGQFRFKTVYPGAYPASSRWTRPPHIHFKVSHPGYRELTTQMYFPDEPLNDVDLLLLRKTPAERQQLIASRKKAQPATFLFKIVLQRLT